MELKQLEHFIAAAEEGSFTAAARRTSIVQSGISMSIRALEEELAAPLFVRHSRHVALTAAGQAFLPEARRVMAAVHAARAAVVGTQELTRGELAIGVSQLPGPIDPLTPLLVRFRKEHPGVVIRVRQETSSTVLDRVARGEIDIGVCPLVPSVSKSVTTIVLATYEMNLICSRQHPFAGRPKVELAELVEEPFIDMERGWATRAALDRAFQREGLRRRSVSEVNDVTLALRLVETGLGVSIAPAIARKLGSNVAWVPVSPSPAPWNLGASFLGPEPANVAARQLLTMLLGPSN